MNEQELNIYETTSKGKQYKNIVLKTKVDKRTGEVKQGLTSGNYIVIEKVFPKGYENKVGSGEGAYSWFSCKAVYKGEEVSFPLYTKDHNNYEAVGGMGDKVKISAVSEEYEYKGEKNTRLALSFDLVE